MPEDVVVPKVDDVLILGALLLEDLGKDWQVFLGERRRFVSNDLYGRDESTPNEEHGNENQWWALPFVEMVHDDFPSATEGLDAAHF